MQTNKAQNQNTNLSKIVTLEDNGGAGQRLISEILACPLNVSTWDIMVE